MRRNPRAKWVLPDVVDPPDRLCFQIEVPNNIYHIAAFRGALYMLSSAIFWQDDIEHTAKRVAAVWDEIIQNVHACSDESSTGILLEDLMSQQIRLKPDDPCIIQMWCIDDWQDWYDPRGCIADALKQPTDGTGVDAGDCREWDVQLRGNEKWLLPVAVSTGDTIEITAASGAWNDGGLAWNCVNGFTYALGACVSAQAAQSGDPLQTVNHMRLIAAIGTNFYDAYNTIIAVPGAVTNATMYFQPNDANLSTNSGSVSFHVKYCKKPDVVSPITIAYTWGDGVTSLDPSQSEWIISVTSEATGAVQGREISFTLSEPLKISIQSASGFAQGATNGTVYEAIYLSGGTVASVAFPNAPTTIPETTGNQLVVTSGNSPLPAADYSLQIRLRRP